MSASTEAPPRHAPGDVRTYAVFMQLTPNQPLIGEGIGQHLAQLLRGFNQIPDVRIIVCVPIWSRGQVRRALKLYKVSAHNVEVRTFGPRLLWKYITPKKKVSVKDNPARLLVRGFELGGGSMFWPILSAGAAISPPATWSRKSDIEVKEDTSGGRSIARRLWWSLFLATFAQMAAFINRSRDIRACIVPLGAWDMCRLVDRKPVVPMIPDLVYLEFPDVFDRDEAWNAVDRQVFQVARHAAAIMTCGDYVKERHICGYFGIPEERVNVVHHAPMDISYVLDRFIPRFGKDAREVSHVLVRRFLQRKLTPLKHVDSLGGSIYWLSQLRRPELMERPKLYFPTQARPYKNIKRLVQAVAELRDRYGLEVTLFLTGDVRKDAELHRMVHDENLYGNIVPLPRLQPHHHAAFYGVSDLVVQTTLFEGGDKYNFLFSEGLSIGTPMVMSRNVTSRGILPDSIAEDTYFDPTDVGAIAERIHTALNDPTLAARQAEVYRQWKAERGWKDVAGGYAESCELGVKHFKPPKDRSFFRTLNSLRKG